jgi:hypothetical protein
MKKLFIMIFLIGANFLIAQQATITTAKEMLGVFTATDGFCRVGNVYNLYREANGKMYKIGEAEIVKIVGDKVAVRLVNAIATDHMAIGDRVDLSSLNEEAAILQSVDSDQADDESTQSPTADNKNKLESWYTLWGLGYASMGYPGDVQVALDLVDDLPGVSRSSIAMDFLGFYWPFNEHAIFGGVINACADRYEVGGESMQINGYTYSVSLMHFLQNRIGKGFFLRGDVGGARMVLQVSKNDPQSSDWGVGVLAGAGLGLPVSRGTRILLSVNYSHRFIEGDAMRAWQFTVSGLF